MSNKNDNDNRSYKESYDRARDGRFDLVETLARVIVGESTAERAGRLDGESDRANYGSRKS